MHPLVLYPVQGPRVQRHPPGVAPSERAFFLDIHDIAAWVRAFRTVEHSIGVRGAAVVVLVALGRVVVMVVVVLRLGTSRPLLLVAVEDALGPDFVGEDGGQSDAS